MFGSRWIYIETYYIHSHIILQVFQKVCMKNYTTLWYSSRSKPCWCGFPVLVSCKSAGSGFSQHSMKRWNNFHKSKFYSGRNESRLKLGNARCNSVQNILSSSLLSKNVNIKVYRTIILPVVLYGFETWSLTLREEQAEGVWGEYLGLRGTR